MVSPLHPRTATASHGGHVPGRAGQALRAPAQERPRGDRGALLHPRPLDRARFFILDEAQQLTPHEVKTVITRISEGSKIVLIGDPAQIDNPYVDSRSNGLVYCHNRMKGQAIAAHVSSCRPAGGLTLAKGELDSPQPHHSKNPALAPRRHQKRGLQKRLGGSTKGRVYKKDWGGAWMDGLILVG
jgi:hypothetical protein